MPNETPSTAPMPSASSSIGDSRTQMYDSVNHPKHYMKHPSGIECIVVTEHMNFCLGNAVKYIWRAGDKGNQLEDLKKARWYLDREIARISK